MTINKKNDSMLLLRDLVNEKILLEEVGKLYKCADGYGYNPFTRQCYPIISGFDIGNYSSLAPPKPIVKSGPDGKDPNAGDDQPGYDLSPQGAGEAFVDVVDLFKTPIESSKNCWDKHPIATVFGVMTGTGVTSVLLKTALRVSVGALKVVGMGTGVGGGMVVVGSLAALATAYAGYAIYQNAKAELDELRSLSALDLLLQATEGNLKSIEKGSDVVHKIDDLSKTGEQLIKTGEEKVGGPLDVNKSSISCFLFVTTGTFALKKMAGSAGFRTAGLAGIRKSQSFLKDVSGKLFRSMKNVVSRNFKGSHSDAYIFLKSAGLLPANAGSLKASARGADEFFIEVAGAQATQVRIPINNFPPDIKKAFTKQFKKLINGNDVVIDITKVNDEFAKASRETFDATQKLYEKQAGNVVKNSSLIDDIAKIRKILARGGSLNPNQLLNDYFKASSEILQDIATKNRDKLIRLQELGIELKKMKPNLSPKDLKKAHEAITTGNIPPGVSQNYAAKFKEYVKIEKGVYTQFSMAKKIMEKDAKFTKIYSNSANMNSLKKWFNTPAGRQSRTKVEKSVDFLKQVSLDLYDVGRATSLSKALKYFAYTAFLGGAAYFGPKITKDIRDNISLPVIDKKAGEFFKQVVAKNEDDYFIKDRLKKKVKVVKLFKDFENYYFMNIEPGEKRTIPAVKQLIEFATKSNVKEVDKFFNEQKTVRAGVEELEKDFRSFLAAQLTGDEPEETTEKETSTKKQKSLSLMSQIPEGDLKKKSPFSLVINGKTTQVSFTNDYIQMNNKKFKFNHSTAGDAKIDKVFSEKKNNILKTQLSVNFFGKQIKKYSLTEQDLQDLFLTMSKMKKDDNNKVTLGNESGNIKRIEENKGVNTMTIENLRKTVKQVMKENSGMGYQKYPYNSTIEDEDKEPTEDYIEEWKGLSLSLIRDETRETAIQIAKILVKDLELFEDVLDLAGQNQSVGTEILKKLKEVQSSDKA